MTTPPIPNQVIQPLRAHVDFVVRSSDAYDEGYQGEVKRFTTSLRALFHDALPFRSLMALADGLHSNFVSTAVPLGTEGLSKYGGLVRTAKLDGRPICYAPLDGAWYARWMTFSEWWNEPVFTDDQRVDLSRRELVVAIANKDGGSNVDPNLSDVYALLSEDAKFGWVQKPDEGPTTSPERAAVRQIAHETLRTLLPPYRKMPKVEADVRLAAAILKANELPPSIPPSQGYRRNDPCPCGSKKRFKVCHGGVLI